MKKDVAGWFDLLLDVVVLPLHVCSQKAGDNDGQNLEDGDANPDTGDCCDVIRDQRFDFLEATVGVDLRSSCGVRHGQDSSAASGCVMDAAGIGDVACVAEGNGGPVRVVLDSATVEVGLDDVPRVGDSGVLRIDGDVVVLHSLGHGLGDEVAGITLEDVDGDRQSDLDQEDEGHHGGVGVEHACVLCAGPATSEECDDEDDASNDDEDDGAVEILRTEEVEVLLQLDLDVGAESDQQTSADEKCEIEQKGDVLQHVVAAVGHLEAVCSSGFLPQQKFTRESLKRRNKLFALTL
jgi:hypothetical protein